jgi:hypothetical protein
VFDRAAFRKEKGQMRKNRNKGQVVVAARKFIAGTSKHLGSMTQVSLAGSSFTPGQITSTLQAVIDLHTEVEAAKATAAAKIANEDAHLTTARALMSALESFVRAIFGSAPDVLADFGLAPRANGQVTVEARAVAVAKGKATRSARHTMGSEQKKGVKGVVPDVITISTTASPVVTTPSTPTTPATSGSPTAPATTTRPA